MKHSKIINDDKYVLSEFADFSIIKDNLTIKQIEILDSVIRKINNNKIYLYYHKDGDSIIREAAMYTGITNSNYRPYGFELMACQWYYDIVDINVLIRAINECIAKDGTRLVVNGNEIINLIENGVENNGNISARYTDDDYVINIKDIVYCYKGGYVFTVMNNNKIKKYKICGTGNNKYFSINGNKIKIKSIKFIK